MFWQIVIRLTNKNCCAFPSCLTQVIILATSKLCHLTVPQTHQKTMYISMSIYPSSRARPSVSPVVQRPSDTNVDQSRLLRSPSRSCDVGNCQKELAWDSSRWSHFDHTCTSAGQNKTLCKVFLQVPVPHCLSGLINVRVSLPEAILPHPGCHGLWDNVASFPYFVHESIITTLTIIIQLLKGVQIYWPIGGLHPIHFLQWESQWLLLRPVDENKWHSNYGSQDRLKTTSLSMLFLAFNLTWKTNIPTFWHQAS